jgi:hypothetical protein
VKNRLLSLVIGTADTAQQIKKGFWKSNAHLVELPSIKHRLSTLTGNCGSPLFVKRNEKVIAIAIHKGGRNGERYNEARVITNKLLTDLLVWEKEMTSEIRFCLMTGNRNGKKSDTKLMACFRT